MGGEDCELGETVGAANLFWGGKGGEGSKLGDFGGNVAVEGGSVESGNGADAALALEDVFPKGVGGLPER